MGRILLTYLIALTVSGVHQGVSALKPTMIPAVDEIVLQEGDDLIIQCEGDESVQFLPQKTSGNPELQFENSYNETSRLHKFVFNNVSYLNSAWYACAEAGVHFENNDQVIDHSSNNVSWIYVYVNSSTPFPYEIPVRLLPAHEGETVVIPCRPTSPDLSVKLQVDFEDNQDPTIQFISKVGFVLYNVSVSLSGISYGCEASRPDPSAMEPLVTLHVVNKAIRTFDFK